VTIRAVTFDLDGTLYDLGRARVPLLLRAFPAWRTLRVGKAVREELTGRAFADGKALLAEEAKVVGERTDVDPATARVRLDRVFGKALTGALRATGPMGGVRDLLDDLSRAGIKLAVVSDRGHVNDKLLALGLADIAWTSRISADDVGALKPHPALLERAARDLGVDAVQLLHVGDRDDKDGALARAFGSAFVHVGVDVRAAFDAVRVACNLKTKDRP